MPQQRGAKPGDDFREDDFIEDDFTPDIAPAVSSPTELRSTTNRILSAIQADPSVNLVTGAVKGAVTSLPFTISKRLGLVPSETTAEDIGMEPRNILQSIGKGAERAAEFIAPATRAAKVTAGLSLPLRALSQGGIASGVGLGQGQTVPEAAVTGALGAGGTAVAEGIGALRNLRNTAATGEKFNRILEAAKGIPQENIPATEQIAQRSQELGQFGHPPPAKPIRSFLRYQGRVAAGEAPPLTFSQARDLATASGALSAREATALNAQQHRQLSQFAVALKEGNRQVAANLGMEDLYDQAMREYRSAKRFQDIEEILKKYGAQAALRVLGGGALAAGYGAYKEMFNK